MHDIVFSNWSKEHDTRLLRNNYMESNVWALGDAKLHLGMCWKRVLLMTSSLLVWSYYWSCVDFWLMRSCCIHMWSHRNTYSNLLKRNKQITLWQHKPSPHIVLITRNSSAWREIVKTSQKRKLKTCSPLSHHPNHIWILITYVPRNTLQRQLVKINQFSLMKKIT